MASQKPTSHDVARLAGISQTTVSYMMSGRRAVAPDTEQRVLRAMSELGYQPNSEPAHCAPEDQRHRNRDPYHPGADPGAHRFIIALTTEARKYDYDILLVGGRGRARPPPSDRRRAVRRPAHHGGRHAGPPDRGHPPIGHPAVLIGIPENEDPIHGDRFRLRIRRSAVRRAAPRRGHRRISLLVPHDESLTELNFISRFRKGSARLREFSWNLHPRAPGRRVVPPCRAIPFPTGARRRDALLAVVSADDWCNAADRGLIPGRDISLIASSWDEERAHTPDRPTCFDMRTQELTRRGDSAPHHPDLLKAPDRPIRHLIQTPASNGTTVMAAHIGRAS